MILIKHSNVHVCEEISLPALNSFAFCKIAQ